MLKNLKGWIGGSSTTTPTPTQPPMRPNTPSSAVDGANVTISRVAGSGVLRHFESARQKISATQTLIKGRAEAVDAAIENATKQSSVRANELDALLLQLNACNDICGVVDTCRFQVEWAANTIAKLESLYSDLQEGIALARLEEWEREQLLEASHYKMARDAELAALEAAVAKHRSLTASLITQSDSGLNKTLTAELDAMAIESSENNDANLNEFYNDDVSPKLKENSQGDSNV